MGSPGSVREFLVPVSYLGERGLDLLFIDCESEGRLYFFHQKDMRV